MSELTCPEFIAWMEEVRIRIEAPEGKRKPVWVIQFTCRDGSTRSTVAGRLFTALNEAHRYFEEEPHE